MADVVQTCASHVKHHNFHSFFLSFTSCHITSKQSVASIRFAAKRSIFDSIELSFETTTLSNSDFEKSATTAQERLSYIATVTERRGLETRIGRYNEILSTAPTH